jgi:hypothetical protein
MLGLQLPPQPSGSGGNLRQSFNVLYILVRGYAACVTVFLRRRFGAESLGLSGVVAVAIMIVYLSAHPASRGMSNFFVGWWIMLAFQRLGHFNRRRKGIILHSQYDGESIVGVLVPFLNFNDLPRLLDVLICLGLGWLLHSTDPALGNFIFGGGIALLVKEMIDRGIEDRQVQRMFDGEIEQRARLARWSRRRL